LTTPQAFDGNVWLAVILAAMFFPSLVAIIRGARKNHLGGILVLNAASIAATIAGDMLATLIGVAIMPLSGLALFALTAWAFAAPGRVADREARQRHHELLAALKGVSPAPAALTQALAAVEPQ
jgi:hypothetical protein